MLTKNSFFTAFRISSLFSNLLIIFCFSSVLIIFYLLGLQNCANIEAIINDFREFRLCSPSFNKHVKSIPLEFFSNDLLSLSFYCSYRYCNPASSSSSIIINTCSSIIYYCQVEGLTVDLTVLLTRSESSVDSM